MDEDGYVRITGRIKEMFIVGGFNCYPAEIEIILCGMPGIARAAVIGVPDARLGEVARAYLVKERAGAAGRGGGDRVGEGQDGELQGAALSDFSG